MKTIKTILIILFTNLAIPFSPLAAQDSKYDFSGYLSNMFSWNSVPEGYGMLFGQDPAKVHWISNHYLQNRLNLNIYPADGLTGSIQMRNRFFYGDYISDIPGFASTLDADNGWIDLSTNIFETDQTGLNMAIDRFWLQYTMGDFEIKAGRQRINWSQTFAFNPNDIFNTYSFFEVDYPERPGIDAIRATWYPSFVSTLEAAVSIDSASRITAAGFYRFNKWGYDFQILGGIMKDEDYVLGAGWSGNINGAGFRGEVSYFHPMEDPASQSGILVTSLSIDYMFGNSLYLQLETLYNQLPGNGEAMGFLQSMSQPMSAKKLSFTEYSLLFNASYPVSPLINTTLSTIYYPDIDGIFAGPSVEISVTNNIGVSLFWQTFYGKFPGPVSGIEQTEAFHFGYLRAKWNF